MIQTLDVPECQCAGEESCECDSGLDPGFGNKRRAHKGPVHVRAIGCVSCVATLGSNMYRVHPGTSIGARQGTSNCKDCGPIV